jgi:hypothetical protein
VNAVLRAASLRPKNEPVACCGPSRFDRRYPLVESFRLQSYDLNMSSHRTVDKYALDPVESRGRKHMIA